MVPMPISTFPTESSHLRVLLVGSVNGASLALAGWIREQSRVMVVGPLRPKAAVKAFVAAFQPQVIVFDADSWHVALTEGIAQLRTLAPALTLIVLACDASEALRRRCLAAGVDAVFAKTAELGRLAALLATLQPFPAVAAPLLPAS